MYSSKLCLMCKGSRMLCGNSSCPILAKMNLKPKIKIAEDFFGPSTSVFVGSYGYPNVNVGPMAAIQMQENIDNPNQWYGMKYNDVVKMRSYILRSKQPENIFSKSRLVGEVQELALASGPTEVEMNFKRAPKFNPRFSDVIQPMGPTADLNKLSITENTKIEKKVERIIRDDLLSKDASLMLYHNKQDVYKISTILSSGILGIKKRRLVPTRWGITAVDDMIAKELLIKIRYFPEIDNFYVAESNYLDNHFIILLMPGGWEYENFEAWAPGSSWSQGATETQIIEEYEPFKGRKKYADKEAGGYYAARLGVVEYLAKIRKQARVIVFREISEGYVLPLGVWVVRETARNAFNNIKKFSTLNEALSHISSKLKISIKEYEKRSIILKQRRLNQFINKLK